MPGQLERQEVRGAQGGLQQGQLKYSQSSAPAAEVHPVPLPTRVRAAGVGPQVLVLSAHYCISSVFQ